jgi:uncharacterized membrane protein
MADPGDPKATDAPRPDTDLDEAVGFASPASLAGRPREITPAPAPELSLEPSPQPELYAEPEPEPPPIPVAARPDPVDTTAPSSPEPILTEAPSAPPMSPSPEPTPTWARETPQAAAYAGFGTKRESPAELEGASGLFSVYALILFAVPTLGVSAVIALLAVIGRPGPSGDVAASHFVFQQRTLFAGAVVALAGAILVVVGLGVFVLFLLALWLILRGAAGVLKLKAGRAMPNPRGWLI